MTTKEIYKPVIVLDVGKVLVDINPNVVLEELSKRYKKEIGPSLDLDQLFSSLYTGRQRLGDILQTVNETLGISLVPEEWQRLWCRIIIGEVHGMRKVLFKLKVRYRLVALSNTEEVHWKFIVEKYPIFKLLDGWVVSYEQGAQKPDPAIYRAIMSQFCDGMTPIFYTDDILEYVEAAQKLGWQAAIFIDAAQFEKDIKRLVANY